MRRSAFSHDPLRTRSQVCCAQLRGRAHAPQHGHTLYGVEPPKFTGRITASRSAILHNVPALDAHAAPSRNNPHSHHAVQFK